MYHKRNLDTVFPSAISRGLHETKLFPAAHPPFPTSMQTTLEIFYEARGESYECDAYVWSEACNAITRPIIYIERREVKDDRLNAYSTAKQRRARAFAGGSVELESFKGSWIPKGMWTRPRSYGIPPTQQRTSAIHFDSCAGYRRYILVFLDQRHFIRTSLPTGLPTHLPTYSPWKGSCG